jgi:hypothetical protein
MTELDKFYRDMNKLLKKHKLKLEYFDNYNLDDEFTSTGFSLNRISELRDRYDINISSLQEFIDGVNGKGN